MRNWKHWVTAIVVIAVAGAGIFALRSRNSKTTASSTYTEEVAVTRGNLTASISPTGQVSPVKEVELSADVSKLALGELNVSTGQQVTKGTVLARVQTDSLERAVEQAKADLLSAEETLNKAKNPYSELDLQKAALDVALAEAALQEAQSNSLDQAVQQANYELQSARLNLTITQHGSTAGKTVRDLEYSVAWHQRKLNTLQTQLAQGATDQATVDAEVAVLADAQAKLKTAQANADSALSTAQDKVTTATDALAKLQGGSDALGVLQISNKIAQAEYNLAKAQDNLATVQAGADAKTVQLAQARYEAAQAALDKAQAALDSATIIAPFDGTVVSVGAEVGDLVSSGTSIVTLADLADMEVLANVDETDISQVKVGQEAQITFDAISGSTFKGKVLEVPLEGTLSSSVVTYQVRLSLEGAENQALLPGMTANVKIVTGQRQNVLLVPLLAIQQEDTGNVVLVQDSTGTATTPVQVGLNDGTYAEVLRGLNEGDRVVLQYQASTTEQNFGGGIGGFGRMLSGGTQIRVR